MIVVTSDLHKSIKKILNACSIHKTTFINNQAVDGTRLLRRQYRRQQQTIYSIVTDKRSIFNHFPELLLSIKIQMFSHFLYLARQSNFLCIQKKKRLIVFFLFFIVNFLSMYIKNIYL